MHIERPSETHARESFPSRCEERHFLDSQKDCELRSDRLTINPRVGSSMSASKPFSDMG